MAPAIKTFPYNSLLVARQNAPITSINTEVILSSWKGFDAGLLLIGSKEMIWFVCFGMSRKKQLKSWTERLDSNFTLNEEQKIENIVKHPENNSVK